MLRGLALIAAFVTTTGLSVGTAAAQQSRYDKCNSKDFDSRISGCTEIIDRGTGESAKDRAVAHNNRGNAWLEIDEFDLAIAEYNQAIRLDPKHAPAFNNRCTVWRKKGDLDRAIADCDQAIRLDPKYPYSYVNRGYAWAHKGDFDRAIADYDEAIRLDPKDAAVYNIRCVAWNDKGDFERALADCDEAIRLDPKHADSYANRGFAWTQKGDFDRAVAEYDEAIRLDPRSASAHSGRCEAWTKKRDFDRAIADCDEAIRLDAADAGAHLNRGIAHEGKRDLASARRDFNTALVVPRADHFQEIAKGKARARLSALSAPPPAAVAEAPVVTPKVLPAAFAPTADDLGRRVALVIGNSSYKEVASLPNSRNDAKAVAGALRSVGFQTVTLEADLGRQNLVAALREFSRAAANADWALVYFAGHGIEMNGKNYLIPSDAKLESDRDVEFEAVPLKQVMDAIDGAKKLRLVILDACRDNPFARTMGRTAGTRSMGRGLARVDPDSGTLVVYAAKDGEIALDGDGTNSPFATALVNNMMTPGLEVRRLFDIVRDDVLTATKRRQHPFSYGSVPGRQDFFFVPKPVS